MKERDWQKEIRSKIYRIRWRTKESKKQKLVRPSLAYHARWDRIEGEGDQMKYGKIDG